MAKTGKKEASVHYPHCYDPQNKPEIIRIWEEVRETKCPIEGYTGKEFKYLGKFVEYTFLNKKKKRVHVPEYCLLVTWLED